MSRSPKQIVDALVRWREHPASMVRELFGVEPDPWQIDVLECFPHSPMVALLACKGPGKGHPKSMRLDTPDGRVRWGDLTVGSMVFAEDGTPCRVKAIHPLGLRALYRVTFDDGSSTRVTADHLWKVQGRTERRKKIGWAVLSTQEIIERGVTIPNGRWRQKQFIIPRQGPAQFAEANLPVDPYLMGIWLGDGSKGEPSYCKPYMEVQHEINRRGYETSRAADGKQVRILDSVSEFEQIDGFGCGSHERFVSRIYKFGSVQQRIDLLRGLMDSDGSIGIDGHMEFASTSKMLADDVVWLVRSLGGVALIKEAIKDGWYYGGDGEKIECRDCWRVTVVLDFNPFFVGHKAERWDDPLRGKSSERYLTRFIASIEEDGEEDSMCIEVDHPSHCYLANDFIVTHNTGTLAWLCWNFLLTRPDPNIAATSISGDNLHDNLWKEMAKWRNKSPILLNQFDITSERIFKKGSKDTWFMSARTWPKTGDSQAQADTLAGLHADYIMFVLDESGGIPSSVMVAAEAALSSCVEGHILQAGNPTQLDGPLYDASRDRIENGGTWRVFEITGDPDDPKRSPRVKVEWARDQIRKYGRENPWVLVNVFGKFPPGSIDTLISEDEVRAAMKRYYRPYEIGNVPRVMGIDVARQGLDASVVCQRQGIQVFPLRRYRSVENGIIGASITNRLWNEFGADACFVDATGGMGFTWIDQLGVLGKAAVPVQFSGKASQEDRFINKRAEMYWEAAQWIKNGGALPTEDSEGTRELLEAMSRTTYFHTRDRMQLEDKDQIKDRIGFSPDEADAFVLTFAEKVTMRAAGERVRARSAMTGAYEPFRDLDRPKGGGYDGGYNPFGNFA